MAQSIPPPGQIQLEPSELDVRAIRPKAHKNGLHSTAALSAEKNEILRFFFTITAIES